MIHLKCSDIIEKATNQIKANKKYQEKCKNAKLIEVYRKCMSVRNRHNWIDRLLYFFRGEKYLNPEISFNGFIELVEMNNNSVNVNSYLQKTTNKNSNKNYFKGRFAWYCYNDCKFSPSWAIDELKSLRELKRKAKNIINLKNSNEIEICLNDVEIELLTYDYSNAKTIWCKFEV